MNEFLDIRDDVREAIRQGNPVVALESTIISHGMPYPDNIECALACEEVIRTAHATPATIAVIGGRIRVGLDEDEIRSMATGRDIRKASRRDMPTLLAKGHHGATTVATTMLCAHLAGIPVFATGGIGGAHRDAHRTFDISADLIELSRTPVAVVCAGAKSILDIGLTLEVLETHGVPVLGYRAGSFPAFYLRDSGYPTDDRADDPRTVALAMDAARRLGLDSGLLVANPIPAEFELDPHELNGAIDRAVRAAEHHGIRGKEVTPFVLSRLDQLTEGRTLAANKELVYANARVAAEIAAAHAAL